MKKFYRMPAIERLEQKRMKAGDTCARLEEAASDEPASVATFPLEPSEGKAVTFVLANNSTASDDDEEDESTEDQQESETDEDEMDDSDNDEDSNNEQNESDDESDNQDTDEDSDEEQNQTTSEEDDDTDMDDEPDDESESNDDEDEDDVDDEDGAEDQDDDDESDDDGPDDENEMNLSANLTATTGNQGTGTADFESESDGGATEREFALKVEGVMTGGMGVTGMQEVRVGGVLVGSINLTNGSGQLEFSSDNDEDDGAAFPMNFPATITSTTTVQVGPMGAAILTGTFMTSTATNSVSTPLAASSLAGVPSFSAAASFSVGTAAPAAEPATSLAANIVDLLLTESEPAELDDPESTEFVGASDQRDAAETAADSAIDAIAEDALRSIV